MFGLYLDNLFKPSSQQTSSFNELSNASNFGVNLGQNDVSQASAFDSALLSGNQGESSKLLAPQISGIAKQANEKTQTNSQFATRSGGTNASNQNTMDTARSNVNDMVSHLTEGAATNLGGLGSNLFGTGLQGTQATFNAATGLHDQTLNEIMQFVKMAAGTAGGWAA